MAENAKTAPQPYRFECWQCGQIQTGWRTGMEQRKQCSRCGTPLRVLPQSPWPVVEAVVPPPEAVQRRRPSLWLLVPFVLLALVWLAGPGKVWQQFMAAVPEPPQPGEWQAVMQALAHQAWDDAAQRAQHLVHAIPSSSNADLLALRRQAMELLDDISVLRELSPAPLHEIIAEAQRTPFGEWAKVWQQRYRHRRIAWRVRGPKSQALPEPADLGIPEGSIRLEWGIAAAEHQTLTGEHAFSLQLESCRLEETAQRVVPQWVVRFADKSNRRHSAFAVTYFAEKALPYVSHDKPKPWQAEVASLWPNLPNGLHSLAALPRERTVLELWQGGRRECWTLTKPPGTRLFFSHSPLTSPLGPFELTVETCPSPPTGSP